MLKYFFFLTKNIIKTLALSHMKDNTFFYNLTKQKKEQKKLNKHVML